MMRFSPKVVKHCTDPVCPTSCLMTVPTEHRKQQLGLCRK